MRTSEVESRDLKVRCQVFFRTSITDPRGIEWLTITYSDGDGAGRHFVDAEGAGLEGSMVIHRPHSRWMHRASKKDGELVRKEFAPPGCSAN